MTAIQSETKPAGKLSVKIIRAPKVKTPSLRWKLKTYLRWAFIRGWLGYILAPYFSKIFMIPTIVTKLSVKIFRADGSIEDYGVVSYGQLITDAGAGWTVDAWQNLVESENMKFHGLGTSTTAPAVGQTALSAELTSQYTGNVRATGTTEETSAKVFKTVGTNTMDEAGPTAIEEFGLFSQAATGGGVMFERALTGTQTLGLNDGLQTTYEVTYNSGG